jgi:outer membrane protein assembly factor BamB
MSHPRWTVFLLFATVAFFAPSVPSVRGENWPGWRGPRGDGTSDEAGLPVQWDGKTGENLVWKTPIPGVGHGSPIVWDDALFLLTCLPETGERVLLRLDRQTGVLQWRRTVINSPLETIHARNSHASSTPATDGEFVYVTFLEVDGSTIPARNVGQARPVTPGKIVVAAYDFAGQLQWKVRLGDFVSVHGFCSNPVIHEDLLIINGDHDGDSYIAALDKRTGDTIWKTRRDHETRSYVTPLIREIEGRTQMVMSGSHQVTSYDPRDGSRHWKIDGPTEQFVASMVYDGRHFFMAAGYPTYHVMAIRPDGTDNVTDTHVAWHVTNAACYVPSPIVVGNYLLVADDRGTANCFATATGERLWQARVGHHFSTSPVTAEGLVYLVADDGVTYVIEPGESLKVIAENPLGEFTYASPAISQGQIFLRGEKHLFCIQAPSAKVGGAGGDAFGF